MYRSIGNLIEQVRKEQCISQSVLCEGLCTQSVLSKIESGTGVTDFLLIDRFLQRLGKSPDLFDVLLSNDEYDGIVDRDQIETAVNNNNFDEAKILLNEYLNKYDMNESIKRQYCLKIKGVIEKCLGRHEKAIKCITESILCTIPRFELHMKSEILMCVDEMELLIMLAEEYCAVGKEEEAKNILEFVINYLEKKCVEMNEFVKVYPKAAFAIASMGSSDGESIVNIRRCEKAFSALIECGETVYLGEIMQILILTYKEMNLKSKAIKLEKQLQCLKEIHDEGGVELFLSKCNMGIFMTSLNRVYIMCSELIRGQRAALNMAQDDLACGIYKDAENISRIETGKQFPAQKSLDLLLNKLGLPIHKYSGKLLINDYKLFKGYEMINDFHRKREFEEAKLAIAELKEHVKGNVLNEQYLSARESYTDFKLGTISNRELYEQSLAALEMTFLMKDGNLPRAPIGNERLLLNHMVIALLDEGQVKRGLELLRNINDSYLNSKILFKHRFTELNVSKMNYIKVLEEANMLNDAQKAYHEGMRLHLISRKCGGIDFYMVEKAGILEKFSAIDGSKRCLAKKFYKRAYYMSDLFGNDINRAACDKYYRRNISSKIKWY